MKRRRLLWQLYPPYILVMLVSLLAVTLYSFYYQKDFYKQFVREHLESSARLIADEARPYFISGDSAAAEERTRQLAERAGLRITLIMPSGVVIADSSHNPSLMENHKDRPEVKAAMSGHIFSNERTSATLGSNLMYLAMPLYGEDGKLLGVVRTAMPLTHIDESLSTVYTRLALGGLLVALIASLIIWVVSKRISRPLEMIRRGAQGFARGELGVHLPVPDSEEIGSLAETMNRMAIQLQDRIDTVMAQRNELGAVLSSMAEGVVAVDGDERLITLNRAAEELLGLKADKAHGRPIQEVVRNADLLRLFGRALAGQAPVEGDIVLRDQRERHLQAHGTVLKDAQGKGIGALVVLNDVTRLRRLEGVRRDFVANVSHEIRTPITSIKGFVETLMDGAIERPKEAMRFLSIIAKQAERLNTIIDDLLALSRIEQGTERNQIVMEGRLLRDSLAAAVQACEIQAAQKQIKIELHCPPDLAARFNATMLEQAVINLIDNAVKYSEAGTSVQVRAEGSLGEICIQVIDQGCGIPAEHLPRLFERFYRVDKARSRTLGGTGLGLAIVKHIAQAHGGRVEVKSQPDEGSTFSFHFPAG